MVEDEDTLRPESPHTMGGAVTITHNVNLPPETIPASVQQQNGKDVSELSVLREELAVVRQELAHFHETAETNFFNPAAPKEGNRVQAKQRHKKKWKPFGINWQPRPGNREVKYGAVRFPSSKRMPAKWIVLGHTEEELKQQTNLFETSIRSLIKLLTETWALDKPSVLISVTGDARNSSGLSDQQKVVFRRNLLSVARKTKAWLITGGTDQGVMAMVGKMLQESGDELPCIGVVPWGAVKYHERMEMQGSGRIFEYTRDPYLDPVASTKSQPINFTKENKGRILKLKWPTKAGKYQPNERSGEKGQDVPDDDAFRTTFMRTPIQSIWHPPCAKGKGHDYVSFIAFEQVDDAASIVHAASQRDGKFDPDSDDSSNGHEKGGYVFKLPNGDEAKLFEVDLTDFDDLPGKWLSEIRKFAQEREQVDRAYRANLDANHSHFVMIDQGGVGKNALGSETNWRTELEDTICKMSFGVDEDGDDLPKPPMVLLMVGGGPGTLKTVLSTLQKDRPVVVLADSGRAAQHLFEFWHTNTCDDMAHDKKYMDLLGQIKRSGSRKVGANLEAQVSFFSTSDEVNANNDLDMTILNAILSDCDTTIDAINLAVRWQEPVTIKNQLDTSHDIDKTGLARAFENALVERCAEVVQTILSYNASPNQVRLPQLWRSLYRKDAYAAYNSTASGPDKLVEAIGKNAQQAKVLAEQQSGKKKPGGRNYSKVVPEPEADPDVGLTPLETLTSVAYKEHIEARTELERRQAEKRKLARTSSHWTDIFMWAVVAGDLEIAELLWLKVDDPLRAAIMASRVSAALAHGQSHHIDALRKQDALVFEDWAIGMLEELEDAKDEEVIQMLTAIEVRFPRSDEPIFMWNDSTMELAMSGEEPMCRRFMSHRHVRHYVDGCFHGYYARSPASIKRDASFHDCVLQMFFLLFPLKRLNPCELEKPDILGMCDGDEDDDDDDDDDDDGDWDEDYFERHGIKNKAPSSRTDDLQLKIAFFNVPKVKFLLHNLLQLLYILNFVYFLCGFPWEAQPYMIRGEARLPYRISYYEFVAWMWTLTRMLEEIKQLMRNHHEYFLQPWNWIDLITNVLVVSTATCRILVWIDCDLKDPYDSRPLRDWVASDGFGDGVLGLNKKGEMGFTIRQELTNYCTSLYAMALLFMVLRFLELLMLDPKLGVLIIILSKITTEMRAWFAVTLVPTIAFGLAFTVLMPGDVQRHTPFQKPFFYSWWGLLGDFQLDEFEAYNPPFTEVTHDPIVTNFLKPATFGPVLLWVYIFFSTIILVNLLIAQMSSVYDKVYEKGQEEWEFVHVQLISEYKDNVDPLPPPLNLLKLAYKLCLWSYRFVVGYFGSKDEREDETENIRSKQLYSTDGFKWTYSSNVRKDDLLKQMQDLRKKYLEERQKVVEATPEAALKNVQAHVEELKHDVPKSVEGLLGRVDKIGSHVQQLISKTNEQLRRNAAGEQRQQGRMRRSTCDSPVPGDFKDAVRAEEMRDAEHKGLLEQLCEQVTQMPDALSNTLLSSFEGKMSSIVEKSLKGKMSGGVGGGAGAQGGDVVAQESVELILPVLRTELERAQERVIEAPLQELVDRLTGAVVHTTKLEVSRELGQMVEALKAELAGAVAHTTQLEVSRQLSQMTEEFKTQLSEHLRETRQQPAHPHALAPGGAVLASGVQRSAPVLQQPMAAAAAAGTIPVAHPAVPVGDGLAHSYMPPPHQGSWHGTGQPVNVDSDE